MTSEEMKHITHLSMKNRHATYVDFVGEDAAAQLEAMPLSFAQQRMWFMEQLAPASPRHHILRAVHIRGMLKIASIQQALDLIVTRHEVLRTAIRETHGTPFQVVCKPYPVDLTCIDLRSQSLEYRTAEIRRLLDQEICRQFILTAGKMLRALVVCCEDDEYIFLVVTHHIASDGWSMGILFQELSAIYACLDRGAMPQLPTLPIQYADFACWQRRREQSLEYEQLLSYWKTHVQDAPLALDLPTDHPRPPEQTFCGQRYYFALPALLCNELKALSQMEHVTLFMTLYAAFATLLSHYTNQDDICVGTPIAQRNHLEIEPLIGFFVNPLVLRTNHSGRQTFRTLLKQVQKVIIAAYAHQDIPFEILIEALKPTRDLSRSALFQVMFVFQNMPKHPLSFPDMSVTPLTLHTGTSKLDLTMTIAETPAGLDGWIEYNTALFAAATIARIAGNLRTLLESIVVQPDRPLFHLSYIDREERQQLLVQLNDTQTNYASDACIHYLFEAQAALTPDAIAAVSGPLSITYQELNRRANMLAYRLQAYGVRQDVPVGLYLERSLELVIGLLGIVKAGGAFIPLDPTYPHQRLLFMLQQTRMPMLLTQHDLAENLPVENITMLCLDTDWPSIEQGREENLTNNVQEENLAYIIYTSGSTGWPKGVMITHQALCNHMFWMQKTYQMALSDRLLQKTAISFDVSIFEFFWPLITGATLVLALPGGQRDSSYLTHIIDEQGITVCYFVASALHIFLEDLPAPFHHTLRYVFCGGESLTQSLPGTFFSKLDTALVNIYGPTETAIDVTSWICQPSAQYRTVPIGRPISNTQIYLLDSRFQLVPIGVTGEVYIGGTNLARGYFLQADLTAERFLPNPFAARGGSRLYRTGDLARYRIDGSIEFIGRLDQQIKLRGFRIEIGEIEHALQAWPDVYQALVIVREDRAHDQRLVAYIVPEQGQQLQIESMRSFLQQRLPDYMLPTHYVVMTHFPQMPNGKIDRQQLPPPTLNRTEQNSAYAAARTDLEQAMVAIWSDVLGTGNIGVFDNFFVLGGHSLLALRLLSRLHQTFQVRLPLRTLFNAPTIAMLSEHLEMLAMTRSLMPSNVTTTSGMEEFEF